MQQSSVFDLAIMDIYAVNSKSFSSRGLQSSWGRIGHRWKGIPVPGTITIIFNHSCWGEKWEI